MTTIKLSGGDLGRKVLLVRCNLLHAASPVEAKYSAEGGWETTQYQCADTRHRNSGLADIGRELAAKALELPSVTCDAMEI